MPLNYTTKFCCEQYGTTIVWAWQKAFEIIRTPDAFQINVTSLQSMSFATTIIKNTTDITKIKGNGLVPTQLFGQSLELHLLLNAISPGKSPFVAENPICCGKHPILTFFSRDLKNPQKELQNVLFPQQTAFSATKMVLS